MSTTRPADAKGFVVAEGVLHRVVGDEVFVLMAGGRVHWLKRPVARRLWETLAAANDARPASIDALTAVVTGTFDVSFEAARRDVESFVSELVALGVLRSIAGH